MKKAGLFLICGSVVVALSVNWASARPQFNAEFKGKYVKPDGTDVEKGFAKKVDMVKCLVCHGKKDGKEDKKVRNDYGKALNKLLNKDDAKNKVKINKALDTVYDEKVPDGTETFGDRIKAGKLPGGE